MVRSNKPDDGGQSHATPTLSIRFTDVMCHASSLFDTHFRLFARSLKYPLVDHYTGHTSANAVHSCCVSR